MLIDTILTPTIDDLEALYREGVLRSKSIDGVALSLEVRLEYPKSTRGLASAFISPLQISIFDFRLRPRLEK